MKKIHLRHLLLSFLLVVPISVGMINRHPIAIKASDEDVTMLEMNTFLKDKKEHYPFSDEFIERYQQSSGGYLSTAKSKGVPIDKQLHLPDQKWHYFVSWYEASIEDGTIKDTDSAKTKMYNKLLCPELLLWIYEACGVSPVKVRNAMKVAEKAKVEGTNVSTMAKNMRECVPWVDIYNNVKNVVVEDIPAASVTLDQNNIDLEVGKADVYLTANVLPVNTTDTPVWSITQGSDAISIISSGNKAKLHAIKEGEAVVKVTYNSSVSVEANITVKPRSLVVSDNGYASYNIVTPKTSVFNSEETIKSIFVLNDGEDIIDSIPSFEYCYGGGNGGSGDNKWVATDMLKIGTTTYYGSITFQLNAEVNYIKITGYIHSTNGKIRIGDANSTIWNSDNDDGLTEFISCKDMSVIGKESLDNNNSSTIEIDIQPTSMIRIATVQKASLYISSIQFGVKDIEK